MVRLLLVDDDPDILRINRAYLERREYGVDTAESAEAALRLLDGGGYDCLVLDVKMKGEDGFALCREIRRRSPIPVIFLTSLSEEECLEQGFLAGGDDYMTQALQPARAGTADRRPRPCRRAGDRGRRSLRRPLCQPGRSGQAYIRGQSVQLTANEFEILRLLMENPGVPFTQEEIYRRIWGEDGRYNSHSIQTLIVRIRRKLAALHPLTDYIKTAWGRGYMFSPQDRTPGRRVRPGGPSLAGGGFHAFSQIPRPRGAGHPSGRLRGGQSRFPAPLPVRQQVHGARPAAESGRIDLRGTDWPARGVVPLIDGWEYYGGALLSPRS